jgi:WD40 repeat protein
MSDNIETNVPKLDMPPRRHRGRFLLPLIVLGELAAIGYLAYPSGLPALQFLPPKRGIPRIETPRLSWKSGTDDCGPFSPDGKSLLSGSPYKKIILWDPLTGKEQTTVPYGGFCTIFAPDGQTLAIGRFKDVVLWDFAKREVRATLKVQIGPVMSLAYSPNGEILAAGTYMEGVTLWNPADGKQRAHLRAEIREPSIMFSPDGQTLACGGSDGLVRLWDVTTHKERRLGKGGGVFVGFTPDGQTLISRYDRVIRLWDVPTGNKRGMRQASDSISRMALTADGRTLALALVHKRTLELWDVPTGNTRAILGGHLDSVDSLAFSPDGRALAITTGGLNNPVISLWDVPP